VTGGQLTVSDESTEVAWFTPEQAKGLAIHPRIRLRIDDYLAGVKAAVA
jgi:hypothetical protein